MKHSKKMGAGYMMLDHRGSPGFTDEHAMKIGLPAGAGRGLFEADFNSCSHCQTIVILNDGSYGIPPRIRDRGYCPKCDRYLCDRCEGIRAATQECNPAYKQIDTIIEDAILDTMIKEI